MSAMVRKNRSATPKLLTSGSPLDKGLVTREGKMNAGKTKITAAHYNRILVIQRMQ